MLKYNYKRLTNAQAHKQETFLCSSTYKRLTNAQAHKQETFLYSSTTTRDLQMLKHTSKRLTNKQIYTENCLSLNTWYTNSGVHNTNQLQTL